MAQIKFDVVNIGGGVMGASIALELSKKGLNAAVIDRDEPGRHASYKAGGMLGAQNEFEQDCDLFRLAKASRNRFKPLQQYLYDTTGIDIQYRETGLIKMARTAEENGRITRQFNFLNGHDKGVRMLDSREILDLGNRLILPNDLSAMHIPNDGQVNANKYTHALTHVSKSNGVTHLRNTEVNAIKHTGHGYELNTSKGKVSAEKVIVTAGAWSDDLLKEFDIQSGITGVKGEVMLLENQKIHLDQTLFMTNGLYIIPKLDHRFLVGATSHFDDFSTGMTDEGEEWLWKEATRRIPKLAESKVLMKSSGIRPYTQDEKPVMDELSDGLFLVGGHYRNGILLSPIVGELMSEWVVRGEWPQILEDFSIERMMNHGMYY